MKGIDKIELKNKKYIIFDMDGTLIDSIGIWNMIDQKLIEKYARASVDLNRIQFERDLFIHSVQTGDTYLEYTKYLINKYKITSVTPEELTKERANLTNEVLTNEMDFKPNVVKLILKLKSLGFTLILATMTTPAQINIYSKMNKKMLGQMNIKEIFDFILTINDVKNKKPHPEIFDKIVEYYRASPNEFLLFEDSYTGVLASKNAGIECINIYDQYADIDRNKIEVLTDYSIKDYQEFLTLVEKVFSSNSEKVLKKY